MEFAYKVKYFNELAGTKEEFNPQMVSLYTGLVLEEAAEMIAALNITNPDIVDLWTRMNYCSALFKQNAFEGDIEQYIDREEFLDGAVDVAVVAIGAGISNGSDIVGACHDVADKNLEKFPIINGERVVYKDGNGKIMKPEGWTRPSLGKYLK